MANDADDLERYRRDEMTPAERHAFEKRALEDPFLRDALSGSESLTPEAFAKDIGELKGRFSQSRTQWFTPIRIAAGIAIVASAGWLVFRTTPVPQDSLAELKNDSTSLGDSTSKLLTLAAPLKDSSGGIDKGDVKSITKIPAVKPTESQPISTTPAHTSTAASSTSGATARTEPVKTEPEKTEPAQTEPAKTELAKTEPARLESARAQDVAAAKPKVVEEQRDDRSRKKEAAAPAAMESRAVASKEQTSDRIEDLRTDTIKLEKEKYSWEGSKSDVKVFTSTDFPVDVYAAPVGGVSFTRYLEENQRIPEAARKAHVRGKVTATFDLSATGSLSGLRIMQSLGYGCDEELLRLISTGPAWSPTMRGKKGVPSAVVVTLEFIADP